MPGVPENTTLIKLVRRKKFWLKEYNDVFKFFDSLFLNLRGDPAKIINYRVILSQKKRKRCIIRS